MNFYKKIILLNHIFINSIHENAFILLLSHFLLSRFPTFPLSYSPAFLLSHFPPFLLSRFFPLLFFQKRLTGYFKAKRILMLSPFVEIEPRYGVFAMA
jgi:hypothetical protein